MQFRIEVYGLVQKRFAFKDRGKRLPNPQKIFGLQKTILDRGGVQTLFGVKKMMGRKRLGLFQDLLEFRHEQEPRFDLFEIPREINFLHFAESQAGEAIIIQPLPKEIKPKLLFNIREKHHDLPR